MTDDNAHIHGYYSPNDLYNKIVDGLNRLGKDLSKVTLDDLQPVDEFHIRGDSATKELIELAEFTADMNILDVGCGIGGSTRRLSHETGCRVTGIDLSNEYIDAAERLTHLLKMQERVYGIQQMQEFQERVIAILENASPEIREETAQLLIEADI